MSKNVQIDNTIVVRPKTGPPSKNVVNENARKVLVNELKTTPTWYAVWNQKKKSFQEKEDYKKMGDKIRSECRLLDENWRRGNFKLIQSKQRIFFSPVISMDNDYILTVPEKKYPRSEFRVLKRHSLVTKWKGRLLDQNGKDWHIYYAQIFNNLMVFGGEGMLRILNARTKKEVSQVKEPMGLTITHLVLGHNGILAAVSTSNKVKGLHYLTIWQRKSDDNIELKSRLEYNGKILGLNIDRSFITVAIVPATEDEENFKVVEFRFISAKTLVVGFCMKIDIDDIIVASGQGLLVFLNKNGSVRISDMETQKDLCVFACNPWNTISDVRINSKYLIVTSNEPNGVHFRVFDLVAAKDPNNRKENMLITSFKVPNYEIDTLQIDEIQLMGYGKYTKRGKDGKPKIRPVFATLDFARKAIRRRRKPVSKARTRMSRLKRKLMLRSKKEFLLKKD